MRKLGIFKAEYEPVIDVYSELREQYLILTKKFKDSEYDYQIETMQGGAKKSPLVATLEVLRKDILAYSDRLCLNPKSFETITPEQPKKSKLETILSELK